MRSVAKAAAIATIYGGAAIAWGAFFVYCFPSIEARFFPVLIDQSIEIGEDDRSPGRLCWTWHWNKVRFAVPASISWSIVVDGTNVEFPTFVTRERDNQILNQPNVSNLGPSYTNLCVRIPPEFDNAAGLSIRGAISYRMPHGGTIWQAIPLIKVPSLPKEAP